MRAICLFLLPWLCTAIAVAEPIQATRTLRPGTILEAGDMTAGNEEAQSLINDFVGLEVRKTIYPGRSVTVASLGAPTLIKRNDVVIMTFVSGALNLRTEGRALAAGGMGEGIEVMNLDTRLTVRAVVTGRLQVRVGE